MPKVTYKSGKTKHFPYSDKGKIMAQMAAKQAGATLTEGKGTKIVNKKSKKKFGIGSLKSGY